MIARLSRSSRTCAFDGCATVTMSVRGYCVEHFNLAIPCAVDGCANRTSATSVTHLCVEHRWMHGKMRRKWWLEE